MTCPCPCRKVTWVYEHLLSYQATMRKPRELVILQHKQVVSHPKTGFLLVKSAKRDRVKALAHRMRDYYADLEAKAVVKERLSKHKVVRSGNGNMLRTPSSLLVFLEHDVRMRPQKRAFAIKVARMMDARTYKPALAPKLWMYWVNAGAKLYARDRNVRGEMFSVQDRKHLSEFIAKKYAAQIKKVGCNA